MGMLKKLFRGDAKPSSTSSQFHESETTAQKTSSVNAPRRELIHVVLRDTMRKHGIPSDWLDCRILSVMTRQHKSGMHVQFIVRQGEDKMLQHIRPFQQTFWAELEKFEARPREWLFSLAWQLDGKAETPGQFAPLAEGWDQDTQPPEGDTLPPQEEEELATDLQALYAIRDAALSQPAGLAELPPDPAAPPGRSGRT